MNRLEVGCAKEVGYDWACYKIFVYDLASSHVDVWKFPITTMHQHNLRCWRALARIGALQG